MSPQTQTRAPVLWAGLGHITDEGLYPLPGARFECDACATVEPLLPFLPAPVTLIGTCPTCGKARYLRHDGSTQETRP